MIGLVKYIISKYSLNHLKEKAKEHGISHVGDKQTLTERLVVAGAFTADVVDYVKLAQADPDRYTPVTKGWAESHLKGVRRAKIDKGIRDIIIELNEAGYYTTNSCSGLESDHPAEPSAYGFIDFIKTDRQKVEKLVDAVRYAKLSVEDRGTTIGGDLAGRLFEFNELRVKMPAGLSDEDIRWSWRQLRNSLLS